VALLIVLVKLQLMAQALNTRQTWQQLSHGYSIIYVHAAATATTP